MRCINDVLKPSVRSKLEKPRQRHQRLQEKQGIPKAKNTADTNKNFKTKSPKTRVAQFPEEPFQAQDNILWCLACGEEVSIQMDRIKDHLKSKKHNANKIKKNDWDKNKATTKNLSLAASAIICIC